MRKYEIIFLVRPDVAEEELDKLIAQMDGVVTSTGGKVEKVDKLGRRRLAYRVAGHREGHYVLFLLEALGDTVREFERRLKVTDSVIKYLTVRVDEDLKRAEKYKAWRAKQEARRPRSKGAPAAAPPAPPAAAETA
jgi:small subunit ribosomal protein S6